MMDNQELMRYKARRRRERLRRKRRRQKIRLMQMIVLLLVIVIGGTVLWNRCTKKETKSEKKVLELVGDQEITLMVGSVYQEEGTSQKDAISNGEVNTDKAGTYTLEYSWDDQKVSRTVHVVDDGQIVMNLQGAKETYVKQNQPYVESGCWVLDQTSGDLSEQVEVIGSVDTAIPGDYEVTYSVENQDGVICSRKRIVHVVEEQAFQENTAGIPVLMYHYVYTEEDKPDQLNTNYILDTKLEEQLKYLKEQQYYFPSYQELVSYVKGEIDLPEKSIVLTFDDGQKGFLNYGIPLLEKYEVPATSFVITSKEWDTKLKEYASEYVSFQSHSYDMHKAGGTIGHGGIISAMSKEEILEDLQMAQKILYHTEAFAYPYGDVTEDAKAAVQDANILCAFTTEYGKVKVGANTATLPRVRVLGDASLDSFIGSISG